MGPEDRGLAERRGGAAEPGIRSEPRTYSGGARGVTVHSPVNRLNQPSSFFTGGVVWRIRASDTRLVCAAGSRNGTEETKLLVLDFDLDDKKKETD